ncbi:adenine nucleotide alpha hydrolases-like protein [Gonapodya prolifera JEL478]|uniref:Adenine nucleotide alpha hydrolases-like protein n=1 Tax=Gonapodya prolifera (strain JEL478) TaxID=1344416 RepID=A0A138ZZ84_GONPJ|nr:adenine nucleotide alpha hydrolases-like protein [Gonapodya prolifera JEL478]|eukprot:KXS09814.1 adenine nucleotide alpha hydrolases-like protein [Gonapodya prolifera JEL478]
MATPDRVAELRQLLIDSIKRLPPGCAISLSGGLDTSIIAEANISCPTPDLASQEPVSHAPITHAVTVLTSAMATDRPHSIGIAKRLNLQHTVIEYDTPLDLVRDTSLLEFTVRTLGSFDPMEIRNSAAVARALMECKKLGLENVATGDGADELFAGYSFLHKLDPQALKNYLVRMAKVMRFSAVPMSEALGLKVWQPYLDAKVLEFALTCTKGRFLREDAKRSTLVERAPRR